MTVTVTETVRGGDNDSERRDSERHNPARTKSISESQQQACSGLPLSCTIEFSSLHMLLQVAEL